MNLLVRPTAILIEDREILLVKQEVTKTRHWSLPGGKMEAGETIEQCLIREIKEETGLNIAIKELLYITDRFQDNTHIIHMLFLVEKTGGRLRAGKELESETEKIQELAMVPIDRLAEYGFPDNFCQMVKSGFPESSGYKGDFEKFYGSL